MNINIKLFKAIDFATKVHDGQIRKSNGLPKIVHPFGVAMILKTYGYDDDVVIGGLLHDVLEDCKGITVNDIIENFGVKIASYVIDLSEPSKSIEWKKRKQTHIQHIKYASIESKAICAADKIHNLLTLQKEIRSQGNVVWKKFNAPKEDILWYYTSMRDSIIHCHENDNIPIFNDLRDIVNSFISENE